MYTIWHKNYPSPPPPGGPGPTAPAGLACRGLKNRPLRLKHVFFGLKSGLLGSLRRSGSFWDQKFFSRFLTFFGPTHKAFWLVRAPKMGHGRLQTGRCGLKSDFSDSGHQSESFWVKKFFLKIWTHFDQKVGPWVGIEPTPEISDFWSFFWGPKNRDISRARCRVADLTFSTLNLSNYKTF